MQEISLARVTGVVAILNVDEVTPADIILTQPMSFLHMTQSHTQEYVTTEPHLQAQQYSPYLLWLLESVHRR